MIRHPEDGAASARCSGVRIGQAARASGTSARALRYYEDEGLITPGRQANGYRDYCPTTLDTVVRIRSLLAAGLSMRLVREVLPFMDETSAAPDPPCDEFLDEVARYRDRLAARIGELTAQRSALDAYLRQSGGSR